MSRIDFNKHREALMSAHKEVCDVKKSNDWALFGYEGQTSVLKVVEKGDGGVEELADELSSGKIMYAWLRVKDPNTGLPKFVLINWQGEGVPELRKGSSASHFSDVKNFFRGSHLTVHARTEDDVDEETILDKISKSSGSNYSFHKEESKPMPEAGPVGSVYKRTMPQFEIKSTKRDAFWQKQQEEEKTRQEEERKRKASEFQKLEQDRKEREKQETSEREVREQERMKKIRTIKEAERKASVTDSTEDDNKWEHSQREALQDEEERRKRSEMLRKQRQAEAQKLVKDRGSNPRNVFEQKPASQFDDPESKGPPPARRLKHSFVPENQGEAARKGPIQLPTEDPYNKSVSESTPRSPPPSSPPPSSPPPSSPPPAQPKAAPPSPRAAPPSPKREPSVEEDVYEQMPEPEPRRSPISQPPPQLPGARNLLAESLPQRPPSDDEQEDEDNWGGHMSHQEPEEESEAIYDDAEPSKPEAVVSPTSPTQNFPEEEDIYENDVSPASPTSPSAQFDASDRGMCARALYDYQAADDTEITFDPDDIITNIDQIDSGWWTGVAPDGRHGMFPANYVELI